MSATLYELTAQMAEIESILEETGGELTPELEAAWCETRDGLLSKTDGYNALIQKLKASETAIDNEIKRLQNLQRTARNGQKRLKDHILECMGTFGIDRLDGQLCKMSIRESRSLKVDEDTVLSPLRSRIDDLNAKLPDYVTVEVKVSKTLIKDQFKGTDVLPSGCEWVKGKSLQIR